MTTPENPERIVAARWHDTEDGHTYLVVGEVEDRSAMDATRRPGDDAPVQTYVREDVAEAAVANAPGYETAMAEAVRASRLEEEAAALRRERDALALALKVADGRIYLLRDGTWTPPVDPACRCGHPASVHAVDDEERRQCLRGECDCGQYDHDAAAAGKGVG